MPTNRVFNFWNKNCPECTNILFVHFCFKHFVKEFLSLHVKFNPTFPLSVSRNIFAKNQNFSRKWTFGAEFFCGEYFTFSSCALLHSESGVELPNYFSCRHCVDEHYFGDFVFHFFRKENELVKRFDWRIDYGCRFWQHFIHRNTRHSGALWRKRN